MQARRYEYDNSRVIISVYVDARRNYHQKLYKSAACTMYMKAANNM